MSTPARDSVTKQSQLDSILERAAEQLGDITPAVFALYYQRYPQAKALFALHGCGYTERLESGMVDSALYCLMVWLERPVEIEILLAEAVIHHETLNIPVALFAGLQEALVEVVATVADSPLEHSLLAELKQQLTTRIYQSAAQS